ncbi:hypothetical protein ABIE54_001949 [Chitinophagaceae bacterium OAS944]
MTTATDIPAKGNGKRVQQAIEKGKQQIQQQTASYISQL